MNEACIKHECAGQVIRHQPVSDCDLGYVVGGKVFDTLDQARQHCLKIQHGLPKTKGKP